MVSALANLIGPSLPTVLSVNAPTLVTTTESVLALLTTPAPALPLGPDLIALLLPISLALPSQLKTNVSPRLDLAVGVPIRALV